MEIALNRFTLALAAFTMMASPALADHKHDHSHGHSHSAVSEKIAKGQFDDAQVQPRALSDWAGKWQSVYPLVVSGALKPVMQHKAEHGDKTADEYHAYYEAAYKTDVAQITIDGDKVSFHRPEGVTVGQYADDGHEILSYDTGRRAVRFAFKKTGGDAKAPTFIVFSDHKIAPTKADHYHLYWGEDRAKLFAEVKNWPTYYPADMTSAQIVEEMNAH